MAYSWPDLVFPPINLWNVPWQRIERRPVQDPLPRAGKPVVEVGRNREMLAMLIRGRWREVAAVGMARLAGSEST